MSASASSSSIGDRRSLIALLLLAIVLAVGWFGWGDQVPDRRQAEEFLAWGFRNQSSIAALDGDGRLVRLKPAMVSTIDSVECLRFSGERSWLSAKERWSSQMRHDCVYRLIGAGGQAYWTVIGTTYFSTDTYNLAHVGPYMLSFWAADPDQRRILAERGVHLPAP